MVGILCENRRQTAVKKLQTIIIIIIIIVVVTIFIVIIIVTVTINSFIIIIIIIVIIIIVGNIISNGNRTEWSPIRSVIIRVINKIGRPRSGSPICLITSMITDRIGRHEVLLPINHNFNKICDILGSFFFNQNTRNSEIFLLPVKKKAI